MWVRKPSTVAGCAPRSKWQQIGGTAEQKVPFEVMCLADAVRAEHAARAYLVLGGDGWTLRDY